MDSANYISTSGYYPDWLLTLSEGLTVISCIWLVYEGFRLFLFFHGHSAKVSKLLSFEFLSGAGVGVMTLLMGLFLYFDHVDGVKTIVILRPLFIGLSAYALHRLYAFYKNDL